MNKFKKNDPSAIAMTAEINSILHKLNEKQHDLEKVKMEYNDLKSKSIAIKSDLESIVKQLKQAKSETEILKQENIRLKIENESIRTKKDFMVGELRYLEPAVMYAKKEYQHIKSDYKSLHEEVIKITNELIQLKPQIQFKQIGSTNNSKSESVLEDIKNKLDAIHEDESKLTYNDLLESYRPDSQNAKNFTNELISEIKKIKSAIKDSKENSN